jgi:hypothetical protein
MTAVASMATWRPRDGKVQEFVASAAKAKKIHERLGATVRIWSSNFGGEPMTMGYVLEHKSWAAFGEFGEKMEKDNEWRDFWTTASANPTADLVQNAVYSEVAVL